MTEPSPEILNEMALRWLDESPKLADRLEAAALEWKLSREALAELRIGGAGADELPQRAVTVPARMVQTPVEPPERKNPVLQGCSSPGRPTAEGAANRHLPPAATPGRDRGGQRNGQHGGIR